MDGWGRGNPGLPIACDRIADHNSGRYYLHWLRHTGSCCRVLWSCARARRRSWIQCPAQTPQLLSISMATARPAYTALAPDASSSPFPPSIFTEDLSSIHELAPEHRPKTAHKRRLRHGISWRWDSARTLVSIFVDNNAGLMLVGASQFFLSAMNVAVKLLNSLDKPSTNIGGPWSSLVITYICSIAYMYWKQIPDPVFGPKGLRLLLVLRGFTGFFGLSGIYFSLQYLSLSDAMVLSFLSPILTGFTGAIFLKEPFSHKELFTGLCSFLGVVLIARPQFLFGKAHANRSTGIPADLSEVATPEQRMLSVIAALIGVLGATGAYTSLRAIGKRAHTLHSITFFSTQCILASTAGMIIFRVTPVIPTHILLTMGLQRETASRGSLANYIGVVFALAFERIIFHTTPSELSIAGSVIIMSSAIYVALTKSSKPAPVDHVLERPLLTADDEDSGEP
ncbi:hypothetical protein EDB87DRAFT_1655582 [Lactarius vividus]|nr:hypothetical protein EDB87DRAFT_1655582 [Lactarius vividus]